MTDRLGTIGQQYSDDAGNPLIDGRLYFYDSGTLTPKDTFSDVNLTKPNTNPVILDGAGRQPNIWFEGFAKIILTSSDEVQIEERDPIGSASGNSFSSWTSSVIYAENVFVQGSDGNFYRSLSAGNSGNDPTTDTNNWTRVQFTETWNTNDTYNIPDIVQGSDGALYVAITSSNTGNDPVGDSVNWVPVGSEPDVVLLSSVTLSGDTFVDLDISTGASSYGIHLNNVKTSVSSSLQLRTSSDGGATFDSGSTDYKSSDLKVTSAVATVFARAFPAGISAVFLTVSGFNVFSGTIRIFKPEDVSVCSMDYDLVVMDGTDAGVFKGSAMRDSVSAVDTIRIDMSSGTLDTGTITLYEVK